MIRLHQQQGEKEKRDLFVGLEPGKLFANM